MSFCNVIVLSLEKMVEASSFYTLSFLSFLWKQVQFLQQGRYNMSIYYLSLKLIWIYYTHTCIIIHNFNIYQST